MMGDVDAAVESFNRYFPTAWSSGTPADRFGYLISSKLLGRRICEQGSTVSLRVPPHCELFRDDGSYTGETVRDFFEGELASLGTRFDERNGNDEFMRIARLTETIFDEVRDKAPR